MVMLSTRINEIAKRERFLIEVYRKVGRTTPRYVLGRTNGVLGAYPFRKRLKDSKTVHDWKKERFEPKYPGYTCRVLKGNGKNAIGHTSLGTVRRSYPKPPP
jgi:hypothetical protein